VAEALAKGSRITGTQRRELTAQLAERYGAGETIRAIAEATGRSFGFVHGLIKESGVEVRGRGGATRGLENHTAAAAAAPAPSPPTAVAKPEKKVKAKKGDKSGQSKKGKKR
jgi:hypothetical protein